VSSMVRRFMVDGCRKGSQETWSMLGLSLCGRRTMPRGEGGFVVEEVEKVETDVGALNEYLGSCCQELKLWSQSR
jgi:hypothetical protein